MVIDCDLIKTIEDDEEVPNYSENSDEEDDVSYLPFINFIHNVACTQIHNNYSESKRISDAPWYTIMKIQTKNDY